ncbi:hypothetical protein Hanom_Chr05g00393871 [Helianthus anomalus]
MGWDQIQSLLKIRSRKKGIKRCYGLIPLPGMGLVSHRGQLMWGLYTKWALSPTKLVFWVELSRLVCNIDIRARTRSRGPRSGGLERASCDQRGRWPLRRVDCYGLIPLQGMGLVSHRLYGQLM